LTTGGDLCSRSQDGRERGGRSKGFSAGDLYPMKNKMNEGRGLIVSERRGGGIRKKSFATKRDLGSGGVLGKQKLERGAS